MTDFQKPEKTYRGFDIVEFKDSYGEKCSLQISSRAVFENEDGTCNNPNGWIWLGIDDPHPQILKTHAKQLGMPIEGECSGWMDYPFPESVMFSSRMHLNEYQVKDLIEQL